MQPAFDVRIEGDTLAGLAAARSLCALGVDPRRLVVQRAGGAEDWGGAGLEWEDSYLRLRSALGARASELRRWRARNGALLRACAEELEVPYQSCGALRLAATPLEEQELRASAAALAADGFAAPFWSGAEAAARCGFDLGFGGLFDAEALLLDLAALRACLAERLRVQGVAFFDSGSPPAALRRLLAADVAVAEILGPVRRQFLYLDGLEERMHPWILRRHGQELIAALPGGRRLVGGLRYLAFDAEASGVAALQPCIQAGLLALAQRCWPQLRPERSRPQAVVQWHSCDGLPLIGPHPAQADALLCTGFGAFEGSCAFAAGELAAQLLVHGRAPAAGLFSPRRML